MNSKTRSNKKNKGRRLSQFKKGNTIYPQFKNSYNDDSGDSSSVTVIKRPNFQEFKDAVNVKNLSFQSADCTVPTKLRPEKYKEENINSLFLHSKESEENIIVNVNKLQYLITAFLPHNCENPSPNVTIEKRQGLCISIQVSCKNCLFKSSTVDLFTRSKVSPKGPPAGTLNTSVLIPALKSKVGISDIVQILTCLNIKAPDRRGLQRKFNKMSDLMIELNEEQMLKNQNYVKHVLEIAGNDNLIDVEVDSSYNNRPQSGYEAATQTFCPMVEQCTTLKLPLSVEIANTICVSKLCDHENNSCKKNYSVDESMASTEAKFVKKHLEKINSGQILKVSSVTSDASAQVEKAVKDYAKESKIPTRHYKCFIHKLLTFQKNFRYVKLSSTLTGCNKDLFMRKLSTNVRARIRVELIRIKKSAVTELTFIQKAKLAVNNIISCLSNDHRNCKKVSFVCTAHLSRFSANYLPYGHYLELNQCDINRLKGVIEKNFSEYELSKISQLSTTNKCESLHHKVFTFAPKTLFGQGTFQVCAIQLCIHLL